MNKPRILFLSYNFPLPWTGLGIRTSNVLRSLSRCGDVTLVCRTPPNVDEAELRHIKTLCSQYVPIPDTSFTWISPLHRLVYSGNRYARLIPHLCSRRPIYVNYGMMAKNNSNVLSAYLSSLRWTDYDILHVSRLIMADVIHDSLEHIKRCGVYTALDMDDIDSVAVGRSLELSSCRPRTVFGRYLHNLDLRRLERYERKIVPKFDACIVCSDIDREKILKNRLSANPWIIPNGVDIEYFQPGDAEDESTQDILFLGNMNYSANVDAVTFFIKRIFPCIAEKIPGCRFLAVGRNAVKRLSMVTQSDGVTVIGDVSDTREFYRKAALVVTPIRFGGGTRIKILEAMAMKKAIVSTTVGVEGIRAADGKEIVLADNEEDFAAKCLYLLRSRHIRAAIGENARRLVTENYDVNVIDKIIRGYYLSAGQKE